MRQRGRRVMVTIVDDRITLDEQKDDKSQLANQAHNSGSKRSTR